MHTKPYGLHRMKTIGVNFHQNKVIRRGKQRKGIHSGPRNVKEKNNPHITYRRLKYTKGNNGVTKHIRVELRLNMEYGEAKKISNEARKE